MALKTNIKDYIGDNAAEKKQQADDLVAKQWNTVNPSGTAVQNLQMPKLSMSDTGLSNWGEEQRAVQRAYDNAYGKNSQAATNPAATVAQALADGDIDLKGAQSSYGILAGQYADKAANMGPFNYDFNNDTVFKSLQNSYMREAKRAAQEAAAQAAARTGGYGNSYGAVAASQQYNNALQNLYDQIPELEQAAYNRYLNERQNLNDQRDWYEGLNDKYYNRGYQEGRDAINDKRYEQEYADSRSDIDYERQYQEGRDKINDARYETEYADSRSDVGWEHEMAEKKLQYDRSDVEWEHGMEELKQNLNIGYQLASLGNYSVLADMLGVDLSKAENADNLNMALQLISSLGGIENAAPYIEKLLGVDFGAIVDSYAGGGSSGGSGRSGGGSSGVSGSSGGTGTKDTGVNIDYSVQAALPNVYSVDTALWDRITGKKK